MRPTKQVKWLPSPRSEAQASSWCCMRIFSIPRASFAYTVWYYTG